MALDQEQRDIARDALLSTMTSELGLSLSKEDRESAAARMEDAHLITKTTGSRVAAPFRCFCLGASCRAICASC